MDEQRNKDFGRSPGQRFDQPAAQPRGFEDTGLGREPAQPQVGGRFGKTASAIAEKARDEGQRIGSDVSNLGRQVGKEAAHEGKQIAGDLRALVDQYAQEGKHTITERLNHLCTALHRAADSLREEDEQATGRVADQAAERLEQVCNYIENQQPADVVRGIDRFARQQPLIFVGGLLVAGLMVGRFLRSSERAGGHSASRDEDSGTSRNVPRDGDPDRIGIGADTASDFPTRRPAEATGHIGSGPEIGARIGSARSGQSSQQSRPVEGLSGPTTSRPLTEPPRNPTNKPDQKGGL